MAKRSTNRGHRNDAEAAERAALGWAYLVVPQDVLGGYDVTPVAIPGVFGPLRFGRAEMLALRASGCARVRGTVPPEWVFAEHPSAEAIFALEQMWFAELCARGPSDEYDLGACARFDAHLARCIVAVTELRERRIATLEMRVAALQKHGGERERLDVVFWRDMAKILRAWLGAHAEQARAARSTLAEMEQRVHWQEEARPYVEREARRLDEEDSDARRGHVTLLLDEKREGDEPGSESRALSRYARSSA